MTSPRGHAAPGGGELPRLEAALESMLRGVGPLPVEEVPLLDALGRVLARDVHSLVTLPPWDNSAMDGFAVRAADVAAASAAEPVRLRITGESAAGHLPTSEVEPGTAARVLTGAILPRGADSVVPVEDTDAPAGEAALPDAVAVLAPAEPGRHVRRRGSDLESGAEVLPAGTVVGAAAVAVLAAAGYAVAAVHRRPRVAVMSTGDELVPPGEPLGEASIHDSNGPAMAALAMGCGAEVVQLGAAADRHEDVLERLRRGIAAADVLVASGGVSVGARDVVKEAFASLGRLELWRVAIQPGKPVAFGRAPRPGGGDCLFFGLPGNPVSSFVTFELFVRPVLRRLRGLADLRGRVVVRARLAQAVESSVGRRTFLRVRLEPDPVVAGGYRAVLSGGQGSHVLSALAGADGLAVVPEEVRGLPAGAEVEVIRLDLEVR